MNTNDGASGDSFGESSSGDLSPRAHWPTALPQKQAALEKTFFEEDSTIHFDRLRPIPTVGTLFGLNHLRRTKFVANHVVRASMGIDRKLTQTEIDALAESANKNFNRTAWARPISITIAIAAAYNGRKDFRFPFYTPKASWFDPKVFFSQRLSFLKGGYATWTWHASRLLAYYPLAALGAGFFVASVINTSLAADVRVDPRLSGVYEAVAQKMTAGRDAQRRQMAQNVQQQRQMNQSDKQRRDDTYTRVGLPPPSNEETGQMSQQRRPFQPTRESPPNNDWHSQGSQAPVEWSSSDSQTSDSAASQTSQATGRSAGLFGKPAPASASRSGWSEPPPSQTQPKQPEQSSAWDDQGLLDDDDASPVSTSARQAERQQGQAQGAQSGSSWDRVRQQAKSDASPFAKGDRSSQDTMWGRLRQDSAPTARDGSGSPEQSSYDESDEASDTAQRQAQKEFDAMLEVERRGR
ncbi:hypothetical protein BJ170DRAFT_272487 [Xylariales sp. AK1849]|nr:hypothetical protein BJ170DRAFT_272487 [Xylariales sp. AK1849]